MAPYQLHTAYGPWSSKDNLNNLKAQLLPLHAASALAFIISGLYPRTVITSFVRLSEQKSIHLVMQVQYVFMFR
jgi:hypothetical protein